MCAAREATLDVLLFSAGYLLRSDRGIGQQQGDAAVDGGVVRKRQVLAAVSDG